MDSSTAAGAVPPRSGRADRSYSRVVSFVPHVLGFFSPVSMAEPLVSASSVTFADGGSAASPSPDPKPVFVTIPSAETRVDANVGEKFTVRITGKKGGKSIFSYLLYPLPGVLHCG